MQVIAVATLGSRDDALKADTMRSLASTTNSNGNGSNNTSPPSSGKNPQGWLHQHTTLTVFFHLCWVQQCVTIAEQGVAWSHQP
jgi:hypothetical protein